SSIDSVSSAPSVTLKKSDSAAEGEPLSPQILPAIGSDGSVTAVAPAGPSSPCSRASSPVQASTMPQLGVPSSPLWQTGVAAEQSKSDTQATQTSASVSQAGRAGSAVQSALV